MSIKVKESIEALESRGVTIDDIIDIVMHLQSKYSPELTREKCEEMLMKVLSKTEVQLTIITGIEYDVMAEQDLYINKKLQQLILDDYGLFGLDEVLAYSICNLYGSIALTNFGYVDKNKYGIIGKLNDDTERCHTFLDDIVGALAASTASRVAHHYGKKRRNNGEE